MKALKTILTAFLLLQTVVSFGQTKEETIEWLNTNGKGLSHSGKIVEEDKTTVETYLQEINASDLVMRITEILQGKIITKEYYKIPFVSILYEDVATLKRKRDNGYEYKIRVSEEQMQNKTTINGEWKSSDLSYFAVYSTDETDKDVQRVLKAIMHLAKLSGAKENKQTF